MIILHSVQSSANSAYVSDLSVLVFNDSQGVSRFNFSANQLVDFKKMAVQITLTGQSVEGSGNKYDKVYFKGNVDTCNIAKGIFGNFIIKLVAATLENYSNVKFICPQPKGLYFVHNFPLIEDNVVHPQIIQSSRRFEVCVVVKAKVSRAKPLTHAITIKLFSESV